MKAPLTFFCGTVARTHASLTLIRAWGLRTWGVRALRCSRSAQQHGAQQAGGAAQQMIDAMVARSMGGVVHGSVACHWWNVGPALARAMQPRKCGWANCCSGEIPYCCRCADRRKPAVSDRRH
jgi:hypothetical protein